LLSVGTLKKKVNKQLFRKFTLNRRRRETRNFLILRHDEKRFRDFHLHMYGYVNRSLFIQKQKFEVSTLNSFKVMIQNVRVQFSFCNRIYKILTQ